MNEDYSATFRFPTKEYAYMEIEAVGSPESLIAQYNEFERLLAVGEGLPQKEWNECIDRYRAGLGMSAECMERMNKAQAWFIKELDKSDSRMKYQLTKNKEN